VALCVEREAFVVRNEGAQFQSTGVLTLANDGEQADPKRRGHIAVHEENMEDEMERRKRENGKEPVREERVREEKLPPVQDSRRKGKRINASAAEVQELGSSDSDFQQAPKVLYILGIVAEDWRCRICVQLQVEVMKLMSYVNFMKEKKTCMYEFL